MNSSAPSWSSSPRICRLTALCVRWSSPAAAVKLPSRAAASNALSMPIEGRKREGNRAVVMGLIIPNWNDVGRDYRLTWLELPERLRFPIASLRTFQNDLSVFPVPAGFHFSGPRSPLDHLSPDDIRSHLACP